jgi:GNAT superfamily N-acetyltransferase
VTSIDWLGSWKPAGKIDVAKCEIRPATDRKTRKDFIGQLWDIYRNDPCWVPPLIGNQMELVGFRYHPFHDQNQVANFVAYQGNRPVGRITAIVNRGHIDRYAENRGFFGFFESIEDRDVSRGLFDAACQWLKAQGMDSIRGPVNPSLNHDIGCLVSGFDTPPTFMMAHNLPYYESLILDSGFAKSQDVFSFEGDISMLDRLDPKLDFVVQELQRRFNVVARRMDTRKLDSEVALFLDIYNKSLQSTWGFVPLSDAEVRFMAKGLKMLIEPDLTTILEVDGKPVGAGLGLLDYNPRIKKIQGRLFPFGFLHLLLGRKKLHRARMMCTYVLPEWQRWGLGLLLLERMRPDCLARGIKEAEFSWVLESNHLSRGSLERGGAKLAKTYRIYDRTL